MISDKNKTKVVVNKKHVHVCGECSPECSDELNKQPAAGGRRVCQAPCGSETREAAEWQVLQLYHTKEGNESKALTHLCQIHLRMEATASGPHLKFIS